MYPEGLAVNLKIECSNPSLELEWKVVAGGGCWDEMRIETIKLQSLLVWSCIVLCSLFALHFSS